MGCHAPNANLIHELKTRHCTSKLEHIAALSHWPAPGAAPLYDKHTSLENAWHKLLEHIHPATRSDILPRYATDALCAPLVSYTSFLMQQPVLPPVDASGVHTAQALLR